MCICDTAGALCSWAAFWRQLHPASWKHIPWLQWQRGGKGWKWEWWLDDSPCLHRALLVYSIPSSSSLLRVLLPSTKKAGNGWYKWEFLPHWVWMWMCFIYWELLWNIKHDYITYYTLFWGANVELQRNHPWLPRTMPVTKLTMQVSPDNLTRVKRIWKFRLNLKDTRIKIGLGGSEEYIMVFICWRELTHCDTDNLHKRLYFSKLFNISPLM